MVVADGVQGVMVVSAGMMVRWLVAGSLTKLVMMQVHHGKVVTKSTSLGTSRS